MVSNQAIRRSESFTVLIAICKNLSQIATDFQKVTMKKHGVYCEGVARNFDQRSEEEIKIHVAT